MESAAEQGEEGEGASLNGPENGLIRVTWALVSPSPRAHSGQAPETQLDICIQSCIQFLVMLTLTIDRGLEDPVYEQVADQVRQLVASGALGPGTALPSVRQLAGDLGVNLNTIARAYRLLESEGFLVIRDRAGVTVAAPAEEIEHSARARLLDQMRAILARLRQAGMTTEELLPVVRRELLAMDGDKENDDD